MGTVLVKHFELGPRRPRAGSPLETRVLVHHADGWHGYTYRWRADGTDADLLGGAATETFTVATAPGRSDRTWYYPSRTDCLRCHTDAAGRVLGVRTGQLNRIFAYPRVEDNQLRAWNHIGLFGATSGREPRTRPSPTRATRGDVEAARGAYLDANCAMCHLPGGPAPGDLDLRAETPLAMNAVDVPPAGGDLGLRRAADRPGRQGVERPLGADAPARRHAHAAAREPRGRPGRRGAHRPGSTA